MTVSVQCRCDACRNLAPPAPASAFRPFVLTRPEGWMNVQFAGDEVGLDEIQLCPRCADGFSTLLVGFLNSQRKVKT